MVDINNEIIQKNLIDKNGFYDVAIDPTLDLFEEIKKLIIRARR